MEKRGELSFKSYDRLFPNQDTMPQGGFGNLIALPLQGLARKNDNSVFVDEHFTAYPDQWAYLGSLHKLDKSAVEAFTDAFTKNTELGRLVSDSDEKPWETRAKEAVCGFDFSATSENNRSKPPLHPYRIAYRVSKKCNQRGWRLFAIRIITAHRRCACRFTINHGLFARQN